MARNEDIFVQDIGKIVLKIDEMLVKKDISVTKLATEARIQYKQAKNYCKGNMQKIDLIILAKICHTLRCNLSDILEYIPPEDV